MRDLSAELARLRDGHARRLEHARAPQSWARDVARRRAGRAAAWAGTASLAILAITVGAVHGAASDSTEPPSAAAHSPTPSLPPAPAEEPAAWALATVEFGAERDWLADPLVEGPPQCGEPLPGSMSARDGFRAEHQVPDRVFVRAGTSGTAARASATIRYGRPDEFPVVVDPMVGLVARDGVVVGWLTPSARRGVTTFSRAYPSTQHWIGLGVLAVACDGAADAGPTAGTPAVRTLEAGDYEVAWMTRVHATEEANARADLAGRGYSVPPASLLAAFREGSYECEREREESRSALPLTCDPGAVPGTAVDAEAGSITFPYRADAFGREVDVTFVTRAVPLTIDDAALDPRKTIEEQNPPHVPGEPMECGAIYSALSESAATLQWADSAGSVEFDSPARVHAWVEGREWTSAAIVVPDARLWITERIDRRAALSQGGSYAYSLHHVVGSVDVDLPPRITVSRYDGPAAVDLNLGSVDWCAEPSRYPMGSLGFSLVAPHTVVTNAGVEEFEVIRIE
ncbi:hypothetical protein [Demequina sp. NBRC 110053]|uniref:hypothetical protein n=1 Tax=Demequina sp. NBRC 110053 TaxID=1570342 RepID=UPI000A06BDAC|nr:hypothetical protein [Demequina sp. NBRC 110053]